MAKHERGEMKRARDLRPDLPEAFARVLDRTLAPEPSDRFATPGEAEQALLQALGTTVQGEATRVRAPRWRRLAALGAVGTVLPGRQAEANFGADAFFAGDLDADGFADLVVGAENGSHGEESEGIAEIYFGSSHGISPLGALLLESNTMGANFGGHGGPVGDLDGDGCDDLFIGALRYQKTQPREGAVFLFRGSRRREISRSWFRARGKSGSWYGTAGGSAGDLNGDGFPDFIVSSGAWDTEKGINVGQVEVYLNTRRR
jgi:hypothetical protein